MESAPRLLAGRSHNLDTYAWFIRARPDLLVSPEAAPHVRSLDSGHAYFKYRAVIGIAHVSSERQASQCDCHRSGVNVSPIHNTQGHYLV